jgi:hypothetical protein
MQVSLFEPPPCGCTPPSSGWDDFRLSILGEFLTELLIEVLVSLPEIFLS